MFASQFIKLCLYNPRLGVEVGYCLRGKVSLKINILFDLAFLHTIALQARCTVITMNCITRVT